MYRPAADWELAGLVREAAANAKPIEILGAGSKRSVGRAVNNAAAISLTSLRGITLYEPTELVMSARAGTPLAMVASELAARGQTLAFEPIDLAPALGLEPRRGTIGAVFATNLSGARRITAGAARDHLIGIRAVSGRGEVFKSGGRVMKNVTGYDLARGLAGSWGTLAALTEVTFKVQPLPERTASLVLLGLRDEIAVDAMCAAVGSPYEITGAAHLQASLAGRLRHAGLASQATPLTLLRIETFATFVDYRTDRLKTLLAPYGDVHVLDDEAARAVWGELNELSVLQGGADPVWRISAAPLSGPKIVEAIARYMPVEAFYDWSGGLVWLKVPASADAGATDVRRVIAHNGGHATLIRAEPPVRAAVEVFQPLEPGVERLTRKLKAAFDPTGILNPGRMYAAI